MLDSGRCCGGGALIVFSRRVRGSWGARAWDVISRLCQWSAGGYLFCLREAFRDVGGFDERFYASEELHISQALKHWGWRRRQRLVILDGPAVTSARKLEWFSRREIFAPRPGDAQPPEPEKPRGVHHVVRAADGFWLTGIPPGCRLLVGVWQYSKGIGNGRGWYVPDYPDAGPGHAEHTAGRGGGGVRFPRLRQRAGGDAAQVLPDVRQRRPALHAGLHAGPGPGRRQERQRPSAEHRSAVGHGDGHRLRPGDRLPAGHHGRHLCDRHAHRRGGGRGCEVSGPRGRPCGRFHRRRPPGAHAARCAAGHPARHREGAGGRRGLGAGRGVRPRMRRGARPARPKPPRRRRWCAARTW